MKASVVVMIALVAVSTAMLAVAHGHHHHHDHQEGLLCSLTIDENAVPSRPFHVPGLDYEQLTRNVRSRLEATGYRTFSSDHFSLTFDPSVSNDFRTVSSFAAQLLSNNFDMPTPTTGQITVLVKAAQNPSSSLLAQASSNFKDGSHLCQIRNTNGFPACGASSLYRILNGTACSGAVTDLTITYNTNSAITWYYGTAGAPGVSEIDAVTVAMHEISHGLGFASAISSDATSNSQASSCSPACSTAFDSYLKRSNNVAWNPAGSSSFYTTFFTSNDLYYSVDGTTYSQYMKIDSPSTFSSGTSGSHWASDITTPSQCITANPTNPLDPGTIANFPNCNGLMKGAIGRGVAIHVLGGNTVTAFTAQGYTLRNCSTYTDCGSCLTRGCEWCYTDRKCGDRTNGVDTCSDANQWVRKNSSCASGNLNCLNPSLSIPSSVNQVLDPKTLTLQCPGSVLSVDFLTWLL